MVHGREWNGNVDASDRCGDINGWVGETGMIRDDVVVILWWWDYPTGMAIFYHHTSRYHQF